MEHIIPILEQHALKTKRKIFLAYLVLVILFLKKLLNVIISKKDGFNDSFQHAKEIANLIYKLNKEIRYLFHVNLLRYNPAEGIGNEYKKTKENNLKKFMKMIQDFHIPVTTRCSFGVNIDAACGQLYARYEKKIIKK